MQDECLICGAPLEYLAQDELMECAVCHRSYMSKTRCVRGHYVCDECHRQGLDAVFGVCLAETSRDPAEILDRMMAMPFCHMHGPEHHIMVGAALLTAYKNAGGALDLERALFDIRGRGRNVPGGSCGFWGACGAGLSAGMFLSIVTGATPLSDEPFARAHRLTARCLSAIAEVGGPRCCKRDSYIAIEQAVAFVREELGVAMDSHEIVCAYAGKNNQCIGKRCPYSKANHPGKGAAV